jgi:hypothetical protein
MGCSTRIGTAVRHALAGLLLAGLLLWLPVPAEARAKAEAGVAPGAGATTAAATQLLPLKRQSRRAKRRAHRRARRDSDRDGLPDLVEIRRTRTHPRRRDTDRDRLTDGVEVKRTHTNPRRRDTDRDGLTDWFELRRAKTDPRRADTDGDGARDGWELASGTDPRNPASVPWLAPTPVLPAPTPLPAGPPIPEPDDDGGETPDPSPPPDTTPPPIQIDSGPEGLTNNPSPTFEFGSEPGAAFECSIDEGTPAFGACSGADSHTPAEPLADGTHTFRVRATDQAGNSAAATRDFEVDTTLPPAPELEGTAPPSPANANELVVIGSAEAGTTVRLYVGGSCAGDPIATITPAELQAGVEATVANDSTTLFRATATTPAGNTSGCSEPLEYVEDSSAPETEIDDGPGTPVNLTTVTFELSGTDPEGSGVASFECRLDSEDSEAWEPCPPDAEYTDLAEGAHKLEVRAVDNAGNKDPEPAVHTWTIDLTAPDVSVDSGPDGLTNDSSPTFGFDSEPGADFECSIDSGTPDFGPCSDADSHTPEEPLADGEYTFAVRATDAAGNEAAAARGFEVDTTVPTTEIDSGPPALTNSAETELTFSGSDPGGSGVDFECSLDGGDFEVCESGVELTELAEGAHAFEVRAIDQAGNVGGPASHEWTVDTVPPPLSIDSGPDGLTNDPSPSFGFDSEPGATLECSIDDGVPDFGACSGADSHGPAEPLADGAHTFRVRATDQAGNEATATRTFEVDTTLPPAPELEGTEPASPANDNAPLVLGSAEAGTTVLLYVGGSCEGDPIETVGAAGLEAGVEISVVDDSTTTLRATATTPAGNTSGCSEALAYVEDSTAPETTIDSGPEALVNDTDAELVFSGSDPDGSGVASFECRLDSDQPGDWGSCTSPHELDGLSNGAHSFEVRAIDNGGNVDAEAAKHEWTVDLTAPVTTIDSLSKSLLKAGQTSELTWHGDENGSYELRAGGADCDSGAVLDSGAYATQPATETSEIASGQLAEGANTLRLCLTDAAGNRGAATTAIVKDTEAPETQIEDAPDPLVNATTATFSFSGSDPGGSGVASFECSLDEAGFSDCGSEIELTELTEGAHKLEVRAIDNAGNKDPEPAVHTWTIDLTPPPVSVQGGPEGLTNDPSPSFGFDSEPGATLECSIDDGVPDFGPCSEADSHTPDEPLGDGAHTFRVRATDQAGNSAAATRDFEVDTALPPPPELESTAPPSPANHNTPEVIGSAEPGTTIDLYAGPDCDGDPIATVTPTELETGVQATVPNDLTTAFRATATTPAGNASGCSEPLTYVEDSTAPSAEIVDGPDPLVNADTATFAFTGSDPGGSGVDFECSLDGGDFEVCESGVELAELAEGAHAFEVRAIDLAGNVGDPASHEWTVDTVPPTLSIDSGPDGLTNDSSPTFGFDSEPGAAVLCSIDDGVPDFDPCSEADSHGPAEPLADGPHTFRVRATDQAGNSAAATRDFEVDTALPPAPVLEGTDPPSPANANAPKVLGSADAGTTVRLYVGGSCEGDPIATVTPAELQAGVEATVPNDSTTLFRATATTGALNASGCSEPLTYVEDSTAPETTIDSGPETLVNDTDAELEFSGTDPGGSGVASFECRLDSEDAEDWAPCTSPRELTELADGGHAFEVHAIDNAGNVDAEAAKHEWTVDTAAPQVTIESVFPALVGEGGKSQVTWHADENGAFQLRAGGDDCDTGTVIESGDYGSPPAPRVSKVKEAKLAEGANTLRLCLTDGAGNRGEATAAIEKDTGRPDAQIESSPDAYTQSHTATFTFSGSDPGGSGVASFECRLDSESWDECTSPREYAGLAEGPHEFEVRAFDNAGNPDLIPASFNWTIDNTPPPVQVESGPDGLTSDPSPTFGFSSEPAAVFECSVDQGDPNFGPCSDPASHTPPEPLADGPHSFRVRATDLAGNLATASRGFEVDVAAPPEPALTSTEPASPANENAPLLFGSALPGSTVRLYAGGTCAGELVATLSPTKLEAGIAFPVQDDSTTVLRADVDTGEGTSGCSGPLTYVEDSTAPETTIASSPPATTYSTSASFFLTVNEPGASTACSLDGAPFAACESPRSYAGLAPGEHSFAARATDAAGNQEPIPAEWTWIVETPPTPTSACGGGGEATTAAAVRSAVQANEDVCVTADVGDVDLGDLGSRPVVVSTEGGSMDDVDLGSTTDLTISQARFRSITLRGSHRTHLLANTIGGTPAQPEPNQLIFMPEANYDVLIEGNDIGWTVADNSGNTGYGCRCYGTLKRLRFVGNKLHDLAADGFQGVGGEDVLIDRNEIGPVGRNPGSSEHSDNIQITGNDENLRITNNWIHHQGFWAGEVTANAGSTYIHGGSDRSLLFANNLIETAQGRTEICGLGTGGNERSNLTISRNTWVDGGLAFNGFPSFEWDCDGGSGNTITRNIAVDDDGGFADHGYDEALVAPNLFGEPSAVTLDAEGNCTSANCNPVGEEPIGYRKPSGVAW